MAGGGQPPAVHAMAAAINDALGNVGKTVAYTADPAPSRTASIRALTDALGAGAVSDALQCAQALQVQARCCKHRRGMGETKSDALRVGRLCGGGSTLFAWRPGAPRGRDAASRARRAGRLYGPGVAAIQ